VESPDGKKLAFFRHDAPLHHGFARRQTSATGNWKRHEFQAGLVADGKSIVYVTWSSDFDTHRFPPAAGISKLAAVASTGNVYDGLSIRRPSRLKFVALPVASR